MTPVGTDTGEGVKLTSDLPRPVERHMPKVESLRLIKEISDLKMKIPEDGLVW